MPQHRSSDMEDYQLAKAVSLSLKVCMFCCLQFYALPVYLLFVTLSELQTAEQRKGIHEQGSNSGVEDSGASTSCPFQVENHLVSKGKYVVSLVQFIYLFIFINPLSHCINFVFLLQASSLSHKIYLNYLNTLIFS